MMWTFEDYQNGLCLAEQVGSTRPALPAPAPTPPVPVPIDPKMKLKDKLKADALAIYHEDGGKEWLRRNPDLLDKILAKVVTPDSLLEKQDYVAPDMPWLNSRRLAYQIGAKIGKDILTGQREPWHSSNEAEATFVNELLMAHPEIFETADRIIRSRTELVHDAPTGPAVPESVLFPPPVDVPRPASKIAPTPFRPLGLARLPDDLTRILKPSDFRSDD